MIKFNHSDTQPIGEQISEWEVRDNESEKYIKFKINLITHVIKDIVWKLNKADTQNLEIIHKGTN